MPQHSNKASHEFSHGNAVDSSVPIVEDIAKAKTGVPKVGSSITNNTDHEKSMTKKINDQKVAAAIRQAKQAADTVPFNPNQNPNPPKEVHRSGLGIETHEYKQVGNILSGGINQDISTFETFGAHKDVDTANALE